MVLHIYSKASYGSEPKPLSRVGGHFTLTSRSVEPTQPPTTTPNTNGSIHTVSNIMKNVMSSATEAESGGLFHNTKDGAMLCITLSEMGSLNRPRPPKPTIPTPPESSTEL